MANNFTKFDQGVNLKGSTAVLTDSGDIKYDSSVSAFIGNANGATGKFVLNPSTEALTAGSISTTGNLNVGGNVSVTGTSVLIGAATLSSVTANSLTVTGNTSLAAMSANSETVTGNSILGAVSSNSLSVTGNSVLGAVTSSSETVTGNLLVNGTATVGTLAVTGAASITGALSVTGNETLQGSLTVNNNATITGTIGVSGAASLGNRIVFNEIATPASPAASALAVYAKNDNKLYKLTSAGVETEIGAGALGGFNFLTMVTGSFAQTQTDNSNFEGSIGSWALYNDGANAAPTSMSGGTPTGTTLVTTGTNPLDGASSLQFTKDAANRQGQGFSCTATVPPAYRGQNATIILPFKITGGSIVQGDLKVFAYAIDGSASGTITPFNNDIVGTQGILYSVLPLPTDATRYRVGVHVASTGAVATTAVFDDIQFGPQQATLGMAGTDWNSYTMNITATTSNPTKGTIVIDNAQWRRIGDSMQIYFQYAQSGGGAAGSGVYLFSLPTGYTIDTAKLTPSDRAERAMVGPALIGNNDVTGGNPAIVQAYNSTNFAIVYQTAGTHTHVTSGNYLLSGGRNFAFLATVPIAGWSSNVTIANSSTYKISSYLASGSRVTGSAPTLLGQYRSYLRNASANTFTETSGDPTTTPTNADGILIYRNTAWGTVNSNNQPTKYDIFVGKNKNAKFVFFKSAGRTGVVDITPSQFNSTTLTGYVTDYDPTTGIATIVAPANSSSTTAANTGFDETGAAVTSNVYFDIIVSENALAVGIQSPRSYVVVSTGNGHGSTNTKIRRFTTIDSNIGSAITYADSATLGGSFTINEDGIYSIIYNDYTSGAEAGIGISLNSTELTTDINSLTNYKDRITLANAGNISSNSCISATIFIAAGGVIRAHNAPTLPNSTLNITQFRITKVSN